jgi:hypothetical protein
MTAGGPCLTTTSSTCGMTSLRRDTRISSPSEMPSALTLEMLWRLARSRCAPPIHTMSNSAIGVTRPESPVSQTMRLSRVTLVCEANLRAIAARGRPAELAEQRLGADRVAADDEPVDLVVQRGPLAGGVLLVELADPGRVGGVEIGRLEAELLEARELLDLVDRVLALEVVEQDGEVLAAAAVEALGGARRHVAGVRGVRERPLHVRQLEDDLAADGDIERLLEPRQDALHSGDIGGDALADLAVAAGDGLGQDAVLVDDLERDAVQLLGDEQVARAPWGAGPWRRAPRSGSPRPETRPRPRPC